MSSTFSPLRSFAIYERDMPAFKAGMFVVALVFVALCNLGTFAVLLLLSVAVESVRSHRVRGALSRVLQRHAEAAALLCASVAVTFATLPSAYIAQQPMSLIFNATAIRLVVSLLAKGKILHDFLQAVRSPLSLRTRGMASLTHVCGFIAAASLTLIAVGVALGVIDADALLTVVRDELVPRLP